MTCLCVCNPYRDLWLNSQYVSSSFSVKLTAADWKLCGMEHMHKGVCLHEYRFDINHKMLHEP